VIASPSSCFPPAGLSSVICSFRQGLVLCLGIQLCLAPERAHLVSCFLALGGQDTWLINSRLRDLLRLGYSISTTESGAWNSDMVLLSCDCKGGHLVSS